MKTILKFFISFLLFAHLTILSGCVTERVIDNAKAQTHKDDKGNVIVDKKSNPAYYALLPLSVPYDIAISPFYGIAIIYLYTHPDLE